MSKYACPILYYFADNRRMVTLPSFLISINIYKFNKKNNM